MVWPVSYVISRVRIAGGGGGGGGGGDVESPSTIAYYPFDADWDDAVGTADMAPSGTSINTFSQKLGAGCLSAFNGDAAQSPDDGFSIPAVSCGLSFWYQHPQGGSNGRTIISLQTNDGLSYIKFFLSGDSGDSLVFAVTGEPDAVQPPLSAAAWHHLVASVSGGTVTFYVDNVVTASVSAAGIAAATFTKISIEYPSVFIASEQLVDDLAACDAPIPADYVDYVWDDGNGRVFL